VGGGGDATVTKDRRRLPIRSIVAVVINLAVTGWKEMLDFYVKLP
jgi:hypothetical protein